MVKLKRFLYGCAQVLVSGLCWVIMYFGIAHGSSAAFNLAMFMLFLGLFHWCWWPDADTVFPEPKSDE